MAVNTYRFIIMFIMIGILTSVADTISGQPDTTYNMNTTTRIDTFNNESTEANSAAQSAEMTQANPRTEIQSDSAADFSLIKMLTTMWHYLKLIFNPFSLGTPWLATNIIERSIFTILGLIRTFIIMMAVIETWALIRNKKSP